MSLIHPLRLFPPEPGTRQIAAELYNQVKSLPIISPHGHTDPKWFASNEPFKDAVSLLLTPDHYLLRMLYSQGISMQELGIGVSTSVGIGGDPINGSSFKDVLALFEEDPETDAVVMIGEIGGPQEAEASEFIRDHMTKPVVAYVAGLSAPKGRRMGHAGAIISAFGESASEKVEILRDVGVAIAPNPSSIGSTRADTLAKAA